MAYYNSPRYGTLTYTVKTRKIIVKQRGITMTVTYIIITTFARSFAVYENMKLTRGLVQQTRSSRDYAWEVALVKNACLIAAAVYRYTHYCAQDTHKCKRDASA